MSNETTNAAKKNDIIYLVGMSADDNGKVSANIEKVTVQSWGKQRGTATLLESGKFIKRQIWTKRQIFAITREAAEAIVNAGYAEIGQKRIDGSLRCYEDARQYVKAAYIAKNTEAIELLRATKPSVEIKYSGE